MARLSATSLSSSTTNTRREAGTEATVVSPYPLALQGPGGQGQANDELASPLRTVAARLDMAAVHFDKIACERQTDAHAAMLWRSAGPI